MIQMTVNIKHLRQIARNDYGVAAAGVFAAVGNVVPLGKRRYIFFVRVWQDNVAPQFIRIFRDGNVGAVPLDITHLPGVGTLANFVIGDPVCEICMNIETPVYILESGEQLGIGSPLATNSYILACGYDEP